MKVLIVGNSAKEYSLAKKLSNQHEVFIAPASDTLKEFATCIDIREDNANELLEYVLENGIDMTIPVSEVSQKSNIVELFSRHKQPIFAPNTAAAEIVFNKAYAKKILYKLRIPTPKFGIFEKENLAIDYIKNQKIPFVIKTNDRNSAVVITTQNMSKNIIDSISLEKGQKIIIEDYIYGSSFSFYAVTDGYKALPLGSSLTYKHTLEGDGGQLTSGMGACSPNYKLSVDDEYFLMDSVIYPTLEFLENQKNAYCGILGVNGIISEDGQITILGWQSFMQDCDAAAVLETIDEDLYNLFDSCIIGSFSDETEKITTNNKSAVSIVMRNNTKLNKENIIKGIDMLDENTIVSFYPNIKKNRYMEYEAEYGQNLILTSTASSISKAAQIVYNEANEISFTGCSYRKDICNIKC